MDIAHKTCCAQQNTCASPIDLFTGDIEKTVRCGQCVNTVLLTHLLKKKHSVGTTSCGRCCNGYSRANDSIENN